MVEEWKEIEDIVEEVFILRQRKRRSNADLCQYVRYE